MKFLTAEQVAIRYGVPLRRVNSWVDSNRLLSFRVYGTTRRFIRADDPRLKELIDERK